MEFAYFYCLNRHIDIIRKNLRPFQCKICSKAGVPNLFVSASPPYINCIPPLIQLYPRYHWFESSHVPPGGRVPQVGNPCSKAFTHNSHLKEHVDQIHYKIEPFKCTIFLRHSDKNTAEANKNMIRSSQLTVMSIKEFLFSRNIKIIFYYFGYKAITIFICVIFQ